MRQSLIVGFAQKIKAAEKVPPPAQKREFPAQKFLSLS
jgi:hypothetical protein